MVGDSEERGRFNRFRTPQVVSPMVVLVLLFALILWVVTIVLDRLRLKGTFLPENSLPIMLIAATVSLLLVISALVIIFGRLNLTNYRNALGLPEGSVQALMALLLILLFFVTAVFLYSDIGRSGADHHLVGISQDRFAAISTADLVDATSREVDGTPVWDVTIASPKSEASRDLAKQIVTTVSTLVVAVAAFYFGAKTSQQNVAPAGGPITGHEPRAPQPGAAPADTANSNPSRTSPPPKTPEADHEPE
jgi:hypothetical protein